jgi:hypothetical protein
MYPILTLKKWVINNNVVYKKCFYMGQKMRGVNKYSETIMSRISRKLQYKNTPNIQNIFALLDINDLFPSVKSYHYTVQIFF